MDTPNALDAKIDRLVMVMALNAVKDKDKSEQVMILLRLGFNQTEIASIIGMDKGNLSRLLKGRAKKPRK